MPDSRARPRSGFDPGLRLVLITVGILLILFIAWAGRVILMLLFAAVVFAVALAAVVAWVQARLSIRRGVAFALVMVAVPLLIALAVWLSGPHIIDQFESLQTDLPAAAVDLLARLRASAWGTWLVGHSGGYAQLSGSILSAVTHIGGFVLSTATLLTGLVLVLFLAFYLAAEPHVYLAGLRRLTPLSLRPLASACAQRAVQVLRWWLLSQMLSMLSVGLIVALGLWALGVPLAGTIGVIAALLTFIPNIGPVLSVVPAVLLAAAISPFKAFLTILLFILVHFLEGNVITPLLERRIVRLPPALTMTAQLLLAVIAGPLGLALAAPLTAVTLGALQVLLPPPRLSEPAV